MKRLELEPTLLRQLKISAYWILGFVILIWVLALANLLLGQRLSAFGIYPRTIQGLPGIIFYPFLHNGIGHVLMNTIPFIILGSLVMLQGPRVFLKVTVFITLLSGAAIWLFARSGQHLGASVLIFGYFGFLVAAGWYQRNVISILIAVITLFLYGSILWGVLPTSARVSWEGHLFGLLAGILAARLLLGKDRPKRIELPRLFQWVDRDRIDRA